MSNNPTLTDGQIISIIISSDAEGCALMRLAASLKDYSYESLCDLAKVGGLVGWSFSKSCGVIDGWDIRDGRTPLHASFGNISSSQDYQVGVVIGSYCYLKIHEKTKSKE